MGYGSFYRVFRKSFFQIFVVSKNESTSVLECFSRQEMHNVVVLKARRKQFKNTYF